MERFVVKKKSVDRVQDNENLLSLLKQSEKKGLISTSTVSKDKYSEQQPVGRKKKRSNDAPAVDERDKALQPAAAEWASRSQAVVTSLDLVLQQRAADQKARSQTGWRTDNEGKKVYSTFRNGGRVTVSGQEGFRLAMADEKHKAKRQKPSSPSSSSS
eukprot:scaffold37_cov172-Ochromonas_danica.AAC.19